MGQNSIYDDNQQSKRLYKQIQIPESNMYSRYSNMKQNRYLKTVEDTSPFHEENGTIKHVQRKLNFESTARNPEPRQNYGYSIDTRIKNTMIDHIQLTTLRA